MAANSNEPAAELRKSPDPEQRRELCPRFYRVELSMSGHAASDVDFAIPS